MLKLNLGCGSRKFDDYINVDSFKGCQPDIVHDLEVFPWPFETSSVSEILLIHVLEHLGSSPQTFLEIIKELYRISAHECILKIEVPHHKHIDFYTDPTHCRVVTPETLQMFSRSACENWIEAGAANTPLALICNIDFTITSVCYVLDQETLASLQKKVISIDQKDEIFAYTNIFDNLVKQVSIEMKAIKG